MWHKSGTAPRLTDQAGNCCGSPASRLYFTDRWRLWSINTIRYIHWYHMAKYTRRGNAITMTRQINDKAPSHHYNGNRISFPGVKRPGRGVDPSPRPAPTLKKEYSCTSPSPMGLHGLLYGEFTLPNQITCVCRRVSH